MSLLLELFQYDTWATQLLVDYCQRQSAAMLQELVVGTDRSILHTLTHLIGSEQEYLEELMGEKITPAIHQGQILSLVEIGERCERFLQNWQEVLDRFDQIDITIPEDGALPEIPHGQNILVLQALQHGIDHRTQICTTLSTLGLEAPRIDGWSYWHAKHPSGS
jgi:uncharacterized damage-inducible protein DinB